MQSNTIPMVNDVSIAHHKRLANLLMELYFFPGSIYYEGPLNVSDKSYKHIKKIITVDRVLSHIYGVISIGAPSSFQDQAKWIVLDSDSQELSPVSDVQRLLRDKNVPSYISLSGKKGYHLTIFLKHTTPLHITQMLSLEMRHSADRVGLKYDRIYPSPYGKGGDCVKLPLGVHPETGNHCCFLDENLQPIKDDLTFIEGIQKIDLGNNHITNMQCVNPETGEIIQPPFPQTISQRSCINKLWTVGLQASGTRHSGTSAIANSIVKSQLIKPADKEVAIIEWVMKIHPKASREGYLNFDSDLEFVINEARRLLARYSRYGPYAELCENQIFKPAMRSACENEFDCKLHQNHGYVNFKLLQRLGIFGAHNAKPKGIGKSAMAIYWAIEDIAQDFHQFDYQGMPAFSLSTLQLVCLANCSKRTIISHKERLIRLGLLKRVPAIEIPKEFYEGKPKFVRENFFALPLLTEDTVRNILKRLREG
ncbi:hypothetical protein ACFLUJ_04015 [Chloroflexota bacterium]